MSPQAITVPLDEWFWSKVEKVEHGCWVWTSTKSSNGYGVFWWRRRRTYAHRQAYSLSRGPIPAGLLVCHHCDNPPCVRPDHLFLGTVQDNATDMILKGRSATGDRNGSRTHPERYDPEVHKRVRLRGERHKLAKLNEDAVRQIRARYATGEVSLRALARDYGVDRATLKSAVAGRTWTHVE